MKEGIITLDQTTATAFWSLSLRSLKIRRIFVLSIDTFLVCTKYSKNVLAVLMQASSAAISYAQHGPKIMPKQGMFGV